MAFSEIKPKTLNLEWKLVVVASFPNGIRKSRKCHFSHYEMDGLEGSESALFRKINMVLPFKAKKGNVLGGTRENREITFPNHQNTIGFINKFYNF